MDSWSIFTWVGILGGVAVVIGGVGSWYFGLLDTNKTRATINGLQNDNEALTKARDTLQTRAGRTEAELRETQRRLEQKTAEVRELATRDVPKPVAEDIERATVSKLQATRATVPHVNINVANLNSQAVQKFFENLLRILKAAGVPHTVKNTIGTLMMSPPPEPYRIVVRPGEEATARRLAEALKPFIVSQPNIVTDAAVAEGTVDLTLQPQAIDFHSDGSVALR